MEHAAELAMIVASGQHREHQEGAPKPYKAEEELQFRNRIIELLKEKSLVSLTSLSPTGWPMTEVLPYKVVEEANSVPVLYVATPKDGSLATNVEKNPRVSHTVYHAVSFERRRETKCVQIQALATVVDAGEVWEEMVKSLPVVGNGDTVIVRIESLSACYFDMSTRPQRGSVDYCAA